MQKKIRIQLTSFNQMCNLIEIIGSFSEDVDLLVDSLVLDAKSSVVWYNIDWNKKVYVRIITDDESVANRFASVVKLAGGVDDD